jgi:hypothetical protein
VKKDHGYIETMGETAEAEDRANILANAKAMYHAMEISALRSGEPTPDVCPCEKCTGLRDGIAAMEASSEPQNRTDARARVMVKPAHADAFADVEIDLARLSADEVLTHELVSVNIVSYNGITKRSWKLTLAESHDDVDRLYSLSRIAALAIQQAVKLRVTA